ncbi:hypothetical protein [Paenibacillus prosopidis]|uniref:Uncharacterized protein n=1 Tax=Paenibacillus prosopidis TaxID=630520 RepID=A0A368VKF8_9BACL|nr:hypothetical protein [Paenibacillus prosopidis]RCW42181.1 hypothetical protein DFP97_11810 [Paenibacillus prosopidis]
MVAHRYANWQVKERMCYKWGDELKYIFNGWGMVKDCDRILFHFSGERGEKNDFYTYHEELTKISGEEYFRSKYRGAYKSISAIYKETITDTSYDSSGNIYVCFYQDGVIKKFNLHGVLTHAYEDNYDTIYDIEIQSQSIWLAYPTAHTIKRYSLDSFTEQVSLGDRFDESIFSFPESIAFYDHSLYVCDMGNCRIRKVDVSNLQITDYRTFDEPVWEYIRTTNKEYVRLESGIYVL